VAGASHVVTEQKGEIAATGSFCADFLKTQYNCRLTPAEQLGETSRFTSALLHP